MSALSRLLAACILALSLAACMTTSYKITTMNGQIYFAQDHPVYDVNTDTYVFTDEDGQEVKLGKQEIKLIKEQ
ncbi:YgdI/YgdR family lipoprotein [uncultured Pseudodesulfovibrio sp.]|uniref:YgdI/YgdR family lipoprotein n=1 Tax=uncultured Pseudodesulfovibrio sp. TaxID=2035858 RepID=UPI0029C90E8D|nr:YgdI/YgdR family lipoprotein [uncultured Pseudodesulfovibrio sp.]